MPYKSKLFRRNNGGTRSTTFKKPYPKRAKPAYTTRSPAPVPYLPPTPVNKSEIKYIDATSALVPLREIGFVEHMDVIAQGTTVGTRLGQKHRVTGVHIRGTWRINFDVGSDIVGYMLVWDRQPNESLATPGDILDLAGGDSINCFPNQDTNGRFIYLGRKAHRAVANQDATQTWWMDNSTWMVDDYWDFTDKNLTATTIRLGGGTITDRSTGALLIVGMGTQPNASSVSLGCNFRVYFEDV